jgi:miniconductance mechanosensitive channel
MQESGGRRIKRAIQIDLNTIRFCDQEMIERFKGIDLVRDYVNDKLEQAAQWDDTHGASPGNPFSGPQLTNLGVFRQYVTRYLKQRPDLHHEKMTWLVRQLDPGPTGLPLEVYVFARTTEWVEYEGIQADIFEHLVAAAPQFCLRVFQEPTGVDLRALTGIDGAVGPVAGVT